MPAIAAQVLAMLGNILGGWLIKSLLNPAFLEWSIKWCARRLVAHTKTNNDDEWYSKFESVINEPKTEIK